MLSGIGRYLGPIGYGAIREKISMWVNSTGVASSFPGGPYKDELVMFTTLFVVGKLGLGKTGILRSVISHGKTIELARIGETLGKTGLGLGTSTSSNGGLFSGGGY